MVNPAIVVPVDHLIDGENISAKNSKQIITVSNRLGHVLERKVYHLRNDPCTRQWAEKARNGDYKDILLDGAPEKDKVDHKMQKDARAYFKKPEIDLVCIFTSDGGFRCLVDDAAAAGKSLCFVGKENASHKLRNAGVHFIKLS